MQFQVCLRIYRVAEQLGEEGTEQRFPTGRVPAYWTVAAFTLLVWRAASALLIWPESVWKRSVASAAFFSSCPYSIKSFSCKKARAAAICFRLKTLAHRSYPGPFPWSLD